MHWKKLAANVAVYAFGDFLVLAISGFLLVPLYTRHLSPADYGIFVVTRTNSDIFTYLLHFGMISAVARVYFIFSAQERHKQYLGSILLFHFCYATALFLALVPTRNWVWSQLSPTVPAVPYFWFAFGISFFSFVPSLYSILLRVQERARLFAAVQIASSVLMVVLVLVFLLGMKAGLRGLLWTLLLNGIVSWTVFLILLRRELRWGFEWEHVRTSLHFAVPSVIGYIAFFAINRFGIIFLQRQVSLTEIGLYGLAQTLASVMTLLSVAFGKSFQPMVYSSSQAALPDLLSRVCRVYFPFMLLSGAGVASFAPELLVIVAPRSYTSASPIFMLLVISNVVYSFMLISNTVILYRQHPNLSMTVSLLGAMVSVCGNFLLVPRFSIYGAVVSSLLTACAMTTVSTILAKWMVPFKIGSKLLLHGVLAMGMLGLSLVANAHLAMAPRVMLKLLALCLLAAIFFVPHRRKPNPALSAQQEPANRN